MRQTVKKREKMVLIEAVFIIGIGWDFDIGVPKGVLTKVYSPPHKTFMDDFNSSTGGPK
jgi:hypothetical protein